MSTYAASDTCEIKKLGLEPIEFLTVLEDKLRIFNKTVDHCEFREARASITSILKQGKLHALREMVRKVHVIEREREISDESTQSLYNRNQVTWGYSEVQDHLLDVLIPQLCDTLVSWPDDLFMAPLPYKGLADNPKHLCRKIDNCTFKLCMSLQTDLQRNDKLNDDKLQWLLSNVFALCFSTVMNISSTELDLQVAHDIMKESRWETWKTSVCMLSSLAALMFVILELLLLMKYEYPVSTTCRQVPHNLGTLIYIVLKTFGFF